jgi:CheY-like chemotaxis protein
MSTPPAPPAPQPVQRDPAAAPPAGPAPAAHPSPPGPLGSARSLRRLLVVDDEPLVLRALHRLGERQGIEVLPAPDAVSALELLRSGQAVDVALIDLVMPGLDGEALLEATLLLRPGLPVILMSGFAREERIERCLERGAVAFLRKPFGWPELQRALEACRSAGEADHHLGVR